MPGTISPDFDFILKHLERRSDYVIWGGFAAHAYFGTGHYNDVDIYAKDQFFLYLTKDFRDRGWPSTYWSLPKAGFRMVYSGNDAELDIIYSPNASQLMFDDVVELNVLDHKLRFVSPEWLLITKMGQITNKGRTEDKIEKDHEVIELLRELVSYDRIEKLQEKLPPSYWETGFI